ncbi:protein translocase subunit SecF [Candidatus Falkowbacteria bacterium]|nr:protein translocase subunit SecF [Candidatus Falkowbacteria bacterium]
MYRIIQRRKLWFTVSGALFIAAIVIIATWGLKFSIDFTGGGFMEVKFKTERPSVVELQKQIDELKLSSAAQLQPVGDDSFSIRFAATDAKTHQQILDKLEATYGKDKIQENRFEAIGPVIGKELRTKAIYSIIIVLIAIILYIAYAFRKLSWPVASWKYGVIAVIALVHDIMIPIGIFAVLGHYLGVEIGLPFVAALLTVLGYSVNDTIVVFDRVREKLLRSGSRDFEDLVNQSVNETLARSCNTTLTTILALLAICLFGGQSIRYFSLALLIGILFGAYSSIFVASPLLVVWERLQKK